METVLCTPFYKMEALSIRNGTGAWKRLPPKSENFIARNKTFVKEISRKQRIGKTNAKSVQQERQNRRPSAVPQQRRPKEVPSSRPGAEDSVTVSKKYLEELLSYKVHHSVVLPTEPTTASFAQPSSNSRVGVESTRDAPAYAASDHPLRATSPTVAVEYDMSDIPGLGRHEVDGGGGARGGGGGPWQSTPLKVQEREVGHLRRRGHLRQEPEGEEYFPWGRPGGGAPLLSNSGRRGYACNDSVKMASLRPVKEAAVSHDMSHDMSHGVSHDMSHDSSKLITSTPRVVPAAMRCSISITGVGDDVSEKEKKQAEQRQWLQGLREQIESKRSSLSPPTSRHVGRDRSSRSTAGDVVVSPVSPREGGFGRGAGPHVDQFVLREKEERRKREMENRDFLRAQVEEKQRRKEEERRKREEEAWLEDERVAVEQARLQAEYQREQEKVARKEEEAVQRHALLQQRIFEAEQAAAEAKQKRRLQRVSPRKSDGVQLTVHGLVSGLEGSVVDIVVDKEQTPPTTETRVSPNPASMDCTGSTGYVTHSSLRSPSLLMYGSIPSTEARRTEGGALSPATQGEGALSPAISGGGALSPATGAKLQVEKTTSKTAESVTVCPSRQPVCGTAGSKPAASHRRATRQQPGGHKQSETQGRARTQQPGGHKQSETQGRARTQQPGGHKQSETQGRARIQQPESHKQSGTQGRARTQQPGGPKQSQIQSEIGTQQPRGHKQSQLQSGIRTQQPGGHKVKRDLDLKGSKSTMSVHNSTEAIGCAQRARGHELTSVSEPEVPRALQPGVSPRADSPPVPALRKKLDALPTQPPAPPPAIPPPLLEAHTEHQPLGLDEEEGGVQLQLPELAKDRSVLTAGGEASGWQGQGAAGGAVLSTLANLKQTLMSAEQKLQLQHLLY